MQEHTFTVLIAEDDPYQQEQLAALVRKLRPDWGVLPPVSTAAQARGAIEERSPTLCIFDVELGPANGIDIAHSVPGGLPVIFVTGHSSYAADAFDCSAIDFVVKPIRPDRLEAALRKAENIVGLPTATGVPAGAAATLVRFTRGRDMVIAPLEEVAYFQAQHKYTRIVLRGQEGLLRINLSTVMQNLNPKKFWRVHRSYVVNIGQVASSKRDEMGRIVLRFVDRDERLVVSRPYEHLFSRDGFA
jgi:DNA-binding LytR/AlgR family response regulator